MVKKVPTTIPRRQLGRQLRDLRLQSGLSIVDAARLIERGSGTLQRLEKGEAPRIRQLDIEALCRVYDAPEKLEALKALALEADERTQPKDDNTFLHKYGDLIPDNFNMYLSLEAAATRLTMYQSDLLPGLVQTADYARVLERTWWSDDTPDELEQRVQVRMQRQSLIRRRTAPIEVDLVIDEAVLCRVVGGRKIMAAQARHLADLPPNVSVRVVPFSRGFPLGTSPGPYVILEFPVNNEGEPLEPTTVYVESYAARSYFERPDTVSRYLTAHKTISRVALNVGDSKHLLRRVTKEFERER